METITNFGHVVSISRYYYYCSMALLAISVGCSQSGGKLLIFYIFVKISVKHVVAGGEKKKS